MKQCYNSPWCEPGERCCCQAYDEDAAERKEEERKAKMIPDSQYFLYFCWGITLFLATLVAIEIFTK